MLLTRLNRWLDGVLHPKSVQDKNIRDVLVDGIGVGIASGIGTFLSVFLVRLGATNNQVGLLTAMPALTGMLFAIPVSQFLERQRNIVPWYSRARFLVLSSYALTGLVPFFFPNNEPIAIIAIWAAATVPQTIVNIAFTVVMGSVAGPKGRFFLMSRRWSLLGITQSITVATVGQFLSRTEFPLNYQVAFLSSAVGGLLSLIFSSRIDLPDREPAATTGKRASRREAWQEQVRVFRATPVFSRFVVAQFVFRWGLSLPLPLLPLYWVRTLNASDATIGYINTVQGAVLLVAYFFWARVSRRRGVRFVLLATSLGLTLYPALTAMTTNVNLLIVYAGLSGFFLAGTDLVLFDVLLGAAPKSHQTTYVGLYQTTNNMAMFFAPLVGTFLSVRIGIPQALMVGAALRLGGFALFYFMRIGAKPPAEDAAEADPDGAAASQSPQ